MKFTVTLDGPAAAGKGTLARLLSERFGFGYLDTGLLFRAAAARVAAGEDPIHAAKNLNEADLSQGGLRTPVISQEASRISAIPEVRAALLQFQKDFAGRNGGAILDGRCIGIEVCPEAEVKVFVTAPAEIRARRRHAELTAQGIDDSYEHVLEELRIRDDRDSSRADAPMRPADDATILDTGEMDIESCFEFVAKIIDGALRASKDDSDVKGKAA